MKWETSLIQCLAHVPTGEKEPDLRRTTIKPCYSECDPWTRNWFICIKVQEALVSHCSVISLYSSFLSALFPAVIPQKICCLWSSSHGFKLFHFQVLSVWQNVLFNLCPMKIISSSIFPSSPTVSSHSFFTPLPEHSRSGLTTMQSCHSKIPSLPVLLPLIWPGITNCLSCWNHVDLCLYCVCHIFTAVHNNFTYYQSIYYASCSDF